MKRVVAARPRISEKTWLLLILPVLWLFVLAWGHSTDTAEDKPITKAERTAE